VTHGDGGKPFMKVYLADTAESLAQRCYDELRSIWSEREVRQAFVGVLAHGASGRPARGDRLEPRELWIARLYQLWPRRPNGRPDRKGFVERFWQELSGQSVEAADKQLGRILKIADKNPEFMSSDN